MKYLLLLITLATTLGCDAEVYYADAVNIGGTIRQSQSDPAKWCWINNVNHTPTGVDRDLCGTAVGNVITMPYGVKYRKVITMVVGADESYVDNLDMSVGHSVGLDRVKLYVTSFGSPIHADTWLGYSHGNIWLTGLMEK